MGLKLITPPITEPVTLQEAKNHLKILTSDEDTLIEDWIKVARRWCEGYQNRAYITQTWELSLDEFPRKNIINIPLPPLQEIVSIKYYDTEEIEYLFPSTDYIVDTRSIWGRVALGYNKSWPSTILRPVNGVIITFKAGYGDASTVPEGIKNAIKILVAGLYERREPTDIKEVKEVPFGVTSLLDIEDRIIPI